MQIVVDSFNLKVDSAQHREGWSGSVTDVLGVIKGEHTSSESPMQCKADGNKAYIVMVLNERSGLSCAFVLAILCVPHCKTALVYVAISCCLAR